MDKIDRKTFLRKGIAYIAEALASSVEDKITPVKRNKIRPPYAVNEVLFLSLCNSCDKCMEACPHGSIKPDASEDLIGGGKPVITPRESPCYMCEDMPCVKACEPGALQPPLHPPFETPLSPPSEGGDKGEVKGGDKRGVLKMGRAVIIKERCHVWGGRDPFCDYCFDRCPLKDEAIYMDSGCGPVIRDDKCTGCGICEYICVADPSAIKVMPE